MITDSLTCLDRYLGIHPALDTAIRWLAQHDPAALPNGRTEIDGQDVYINVMDAALRPAEGADFEYHRLYADLQIDLTGSEYWAWTGRLTRRRTAALPPGPSSPAACWGRGGSLSSCRESTTSPAASAPYPRRCAKRWSRSAWAADPPRKGG